jgi:hypothetical protein
MQRLAATASGATMLCWALTGVAAGVAVDQASKDQLRAAQKTFQVADDLYDAKRFAEALTAYRASYDIVASPNSRLMIARCLRELGRIEEAYRALEGTIADAEKFSAKDEKYAEAGRAAQAELDALKARVALLTLRVENAPPGTTLSVAGRDVKLDALDRPLVLDPGAVVVVAAPPERPEVRRELALEAGKSSTLELDLTPGALEKPPSVEPTSPEPRPHDGGGGGSVAVDSSSTPLRTWAYVAGGVGVAGLATFGIFGALNNSKFDELDSECTDGHCPPDRGGDIDTGKSYQTIANVGLAVGIVGLGTGAVLFVLSSGKEKRASAGSTFVSVGPGNLRIGGRF